MRHRRASCAAAGIACDMAYRGNMKKRHAEGRTTSGARYRRSSSATTSSHRRRGGGEGVSRSRRAEQRAAGRACARPCAPDRMTSISAERIAAIEARREELQNAMSAPDARARGVRPAVQGLCRDRAGRRGGARGAAAARRARACSTEMLADAERRDARRWRPRRCDELQPQLPEAERALALKLLPRDAADERAGDARDPRRHRRRRGGPVRRRPVPHVPALCREPGLAGRDHLGQRRPRSAASRKWSPRSPARACSPG